jgi:hypothetical protein
MGDVGHNGFEVRMNTLRHGPAAFVVVLATVLGSGVRLPAAEWKPHAVRQRNGAAQEIRIPAKLQIVTESWNRVVAVPYLIYMPEKDRLLMLIGCDYPHRAMVIFSGDHGVTWSTPKHVHVDEKRMPDVGLSTGLTYLGNGRVMATEALKHWVSNDYGETWASIANPPASNGNAWYEWDPLLVDKDPKTGAVARLMSFGSDNLQPDGHFQGYVRFSTDEGRTWNHEIKVPELYAVNEAALVRVRNGDIVAACRTDNPQRFKNEIDHYGGLGVSLSKDNGNTWSKRNMLFEFGRHHPSMVLLPNGDLVMTYVVRKGYVATPDGFPRFGIEAVVSHDQGQTWDLDHGYLLHTWVGRRKGPNAWWPSSQATSTILLPDGSLLTAFGSGYRSESGPQNRPRDVGLVLWRPGDQPLNSDRTIRDAPFDSDRRNVLDPETGKPGSRDQL